MDSADPRGPQVLRRTLDCAIVADNFKTRDFPVGKYARRKAWNGPMVRSSSQSRCLRECRSAASSTPSSIMAADAACR